MTKKIELSDKDLKSSFIKILIMYTNVDMCTQNGLSTQMESMNIINRRMKDMKNKYLGMKNIMSERKISVYWIKGISYYRIKDHQTQRQSNINC